MVKDRRRSAGRRSSEMSVNPPGGRFFPRRTAIRACHARGGADGDRTHDLRLAKPALSQLSYSPADPRSTGCASRCGLAGKVGPGRVELPTLPLSGVRSSRLSYGPGRPWARRPAASGLSKLNSSARVDSVGPQAPATWSPAIDLVSVEARRPRTRSLRKEVIQPQVPLRLPCYDFTPVTNHTMASYPPCGLDHWPPG